MIRGKLLVIAACMSCSAYSLAHAQLKQDEARGEMLYSAHCRECHTAEVHWREKKRASDWSSLKAQVRRWQNNIGLGWDEDDIDSVARYLNSNHYRFPVHTADTVAYGSGGIGQEDRHTTQGTVKDHNLKLVFAERGSGAWHSFRAASKSGRHSRWKASLATAQRPGLKLRIVAYSITPLDVSGDGRGSDRTAGG